uniref:IMD domain-containing protein n=1 Tax=Megaselia scalaris TaxID=36166 RepID=T1GM61_MEGSC
FQNILEKFNPSARQLIAAGKAYLKALHASAAASNTFNESLLKMSLNAQQCGNGTSASDIGVSIANVASVYKEIHDHHTNIVS